MTVMTKPNKRDVKKSTPLPVMGTATPTVISETAVPKAKQKKKKRK